VLAFGLVQHVGAARIDLDDRPHALSHDTRVLSRWLARWVGPRQPPHVSAHAQQIPVPDVLRADLRTRALAPRRARRWVHQSSAPLHPVQSLDTGSRPFRDDPPAGSFSSL
jgi:hypothetical protein